MKTINIIHTIILIIFLIMYYRLRIRSILFRNKKFKCVDCGKCCKYIVWLNDKDIKRIKTKVDYIRKIGNKKYIQIKNMRCIFLKEKDGKSSCSIYDMRPGVCRRFPDKIILGMKAKDARCKGLT